MAASFGELFIKGGWVMWPLLICSILTWAVVLERAYVYLTLRPKLTQLGQNILATLQQGDLSRAKEMCRGQSAAIGGIFLGTLETNKGREAAERVTDRNRTRLISHFKKNLWILGTIGSASPFIGLLGTVVGIVKAFHSMAEKGAGGFSVVAGGISEALIATAAGLIVAILALLTYNVFVTAANQTVQGIKLTLEEVLDHVYDKSGAQAAKA